MAEFEKIIQINLMGSFRCAAKSAAGMLSLEPLQDGERGVIINTSSVAAQDGQIGQAASKAGVVGMTRSPMFLPMALTQKAGIAEHYMGPGIRERYPDIPEFSEFMGAEIIAEKYGQGRDDLHRFALESHRRAIAATEAGR